MKPGGNDRLEHFVTKAVRDLPDRRAPRDLEARVLAALAAGASSPRAWQRWPFVVRAAFTFAAGAVGIFSVCFLFSGLHSVGTAAASGGGESPLGGMVGLAMTLGTTFGSAIAALPGYLLAAVGAGVVTAGVLLVALATVVCRFAQDHLDSNFSLT